MPLMITAQREFVVFCAFAAFLFYPPSSALAKSDVVLYARAEMTGRDRLGA